MNVAEQFQKDTSAHEMTVLHEDGLYRHLRFRRFAPVREGEAPGWSSSHWFDLITWPGHLAIAGDNGSFMFSRADDMCGFFRGDRINPGYWAEKVRAGDRAGTMAYSDERFRQFVMGAAAEAEPEWPGLTEAVERDIFGDLSQWNTEYEEGAREALRDFEFGLTYRATCTCGERGEAGLTYLQAEQWCRDHRRERGLGHITGTDRAGGFQFTDTWEWDLQDFNYHFLWCCHAIQWGISQYDQVKVPA